MSSCCLLSLVRLAVVEGPTLRGQQGAVRCTLLHVLSQVGLPGLDQPQPGCEGDLVTGVQTGCQGDLVPGDGCTDGCLRALPSSLRGRK